MSATDFPHAVARVSEGFCPLCDGELVREPIGPDGQQWGRCEPCDQSWWLKQLDDGRPYLAFFRVLTADERRKLFDRSAS